MTTERQYTQALGREVQLRPGTSDRQVWADTFTGLYHLPPEDMPTPATVLDLGANIGLTAAHYRALWPTADILAVEMDARSAQLATENAPGVRVRNIAVVGRSGGYYRYQREGILAEAYHVIPADPNAGGPGDTYVPSRTISEILVDWPAIAVDFCKMDVEGEEWSIFARGGWAPLVKHLLVELHVAPDFPGEVGDTTDLLEHAIEMLTGLGYQARHHPPHPQAVYAWR